MSRLRHEPRCVSSRSESYFALDCPAVCFFVSGDCSVEHCVTDRWTGRCDCPMVFGRVAVRSLVVAIGAAVVLARINHLPARITALGMVCVIVNMQFQANLVQTDL